MEGTPPQNHLNTQLNRCKHRHTFEKLLRVLNLGNQRTKPILIQGVAPRTDHPPPCLQNDWRTWAPLPLRTCTDGPQQLTESQIPLCLDPPGPKPELLVTHLTQRQGTLRNSPQSPNHSFSNTGDLRKSLTTCNYVEAFWKPREVKREVEALPSSLSQFGFDSV
jgi:hypothetical protein